MGVPIKSKKNPRHLGLLLSEIIRIKSNSCETAKNMGEIGCFIILFLYICKH